MTDNEDQSFFNNCKGTDKDLNHILSSFEDSEHEIPTFCDSQYLSMTDIKSLFKKNSSGFQVLSLNVQSNCAKFDNIFPIISK